MPLTLHTIRPAKGAQKKRKRVGRGLSKKGTYSGRGSKGQRSRSGGKSGLQLKGLRQIMLATPKKKGFKSNKPTPEVVNVGTLSKTFAEGNTVTPQALLEKGLVSKIANGVKILGNGSLSIKLSLTGCKVSKVAKEKIEKAGGTVKLAK